MWSTGRSIRNYDATIHILWSSAKIQCRYCNRSSISLSCHNSRICLHQFTQETIYKRNCCYPNGAFGYIFRIYPRYHTAFDFPLLGSLLIIIIGGSVLSYYFYGCAVQMIGPTKTTLIASVEVVAQLYRPLFFLARRMPL